MTIIVDKQHLISNKHCSFCILAHFFLNKNPMRYVQMYPHFNDGETTNVKWLAQDHLASHWQSQVLRTLCLTTVRAKLLQSCLTLCDPVNCSPPGSSLHGILHVRLLKWVAISSSRESSQPRDQTSISYVSYLGRQVLKDESYKSGLWINK